MIRARPMLMLDLDGVFVDFEGGFKVIFGVHPDEITEAEKWKLVEQRPSFFEELPLFPGAIDFYRKVTRLYPMFLTAAPKIGYAKAARAKRRYVHTHIDPNVIVLPVPGGSNKPVFMQQPGDVLVDDHERNCTLWTDEGGIAILHRDFETTITQLEAIYGPHEQW